MDAVRGNQDRIPYPRRERPAVDIELVTASDDMNQLIVWMRMRLKGISNIHL
jgi:hypothetical protein